MEYIIGIWIVLSLVVGLIAIDKKIGYWNTFLISLLLSPLVGLIIALASKDANQISETKTVSSEIEKLSSLHASGTLSKEEFESAKKRVLNS